jgi:hypothetical protein
MVDSPAGGSEVDLELADATFGVVDSVLDVVEEGLVVGTLGRRVIKANSIEL